MNRYCIAYPNQGNYSETFIYNQLRYLAPEYTLTGGWRPFKTEKNTSIISLPLGEPIRIAIKRMASSWYPSFFNHYLLSHLRKIAPTAVLAQYGVTGVMVLNACKESNIPLIVHFHGFDASDAVTLKKYAQDYQEMFSYARSLVAVSNDMKRQLLRLGAPEHKIKLIPYGVDTTFFNGAHPETSEKNILAVGRFTGKKAPHLTIKAFKKVSQHHPEARLIMIGSGEMQEYCEQLIQELELTEKVQLVGVLDKEGIRTWMYKSRMFVQHSMVNPENGDSEGTPNTILEASACGLPIVSTRHAGIKDAVNHNHTGFLSEEGDWENMALHMDRLLTDADLAATMGKAAREKMLLEYELPNQIEKLKALLI